MPVSGRPPAEAVIDDALVRALLAAQHPDLAFLPLQEAASGWDNAMFRLGRDLAVRLPRRHVADRLMCHEQIWLPRLAAQLTLPVPAPVRVGLPTADYPWHWSVVPWLDGVSADSAALESGDAVTLGRFLKSLHVAPPAEAPANPFRDITLARRAEADEARLERLSRVTGLPPDVRRIWEDAVSDPMDSSRTCIHGDLHPFNVIVREGRLAAIIDWGDLTAGDPATDLASMWMLFDDDNARQAAVDAYGGVSPATISRARGWAVVIGLVLLEAGLSDRSSSAAVGMRIIARLGAASDAI
jgi:aminoglycoside phosphotransferase (APT) family kinase protein